MTSAGEPGAPVPVAVLMRTSTLALQDPLSSLRRQMRSCDEWLPEGWYVAGHYWDVESGGIDLEDRSQGTGHEQFVAAGIPRDGGMAELLHQASAPEPPFAAVICEDIERSGRDTYNALKLERQLSDKGVPLFATDEPADVQGIGPTTVLVRRIKQGVAEYFRLQLKKKTWDGLREHAIAGWNIGVAPYGYTADRTPHPVAYKAQQGKTKTRLVLDPERAPVVAAIFLWRTEQRLGIPAITARLNADHGQYPPPAGGRWLESTVGAILANPKYTGHMVFGRRRKTGRTHIPVPPDRWIWSPEPAHPAIITRELWDEAQAIGREHRSASDALASTQPRARRNYPLRSRVRCNLCQRRMCGVTRYTTRDHAAGAAHIYYMCTHDPDQPRHAAAHPDHPRTLSIRQDILLDQIRRFFNDRVFGPERRELLTGQIPATEAQAAAQADRQREALTKELARIDLAQRSQILQIESLSTDPADGAAKAMRARCNERFAELHAQRETAEAQLTALDTTAPAYGGNADLLDPLPLITGIIDQIPARLQAASTRHSTSSASTAKTKTRSASTPPSPPAPPAPSPPSAPTPATTPPTSPPRASRPPQPAQPFTLHHNPRWGVTRARPGADHTLAALKSIRAARPGGYRLYVIADNLSANKTPLIRAWAKRANVELCFTSTNASWANPIEAQFGPLRTFTMGGSDHPSHTVLARACRTTCAGATPTPATPTSWPPSAANARIRSQRQQCWGRPRPKLKAA